MLIDYEEKYLKYKAKYTQLKNQAGGIVSLNENQAFDPFYEKIKTCRELLNLRLVNKINKQYIDDNIVHLYNNIIAQKNSNYPIYQIDKYNIDFPNNSFHFWEIKNEDINRENILDLIELVKKHNLGIVVNTCAIKNIKSQYLKKGKTIPNFILGNTRSLETFNEHNFVIRAVRFDGLLLRYMSSENKNNYDVCIEAVRQNGASLQFASSDIKNNYNVCIEAVRQNYKAYDFISENLKKNKLIGLETVRQNGMFVQFIHSDLKNDFDIGLAAVRQNYKAYDLISENLKKNSQIILIAESKGYLFDRKKITLSLSKLSRNVIENDDIYDVDDVNDVDDVDVKNVENDENDHGEFDNDIYKINNVIADVKYENLGKTKKEIRDDIKIYNQEQKMLRDAKEQSLLVKKPNERVVRIDDDDVNDIQYRYLDNELDDEDDVNDIEYHYLANELDDDNDDNDDNDEPI